MGARTPKTKYIVSMDYQQVIQKNITKITIGIAVVGFTTFTVWYYNSHKTEQEPYIEQVPSSPLNNNTSSTNQTVSNKNTLNDASIDQSTNSSSNSATSST